VSDALRIALVSPHEWPPRDDVTHHVAAEARALAGLGHRVTILAPSPDRALVAAGRAVLLRAHSGEPEALVAPPGGVLEVVTGRALLAGPGRRVGEPFDLAATLETTLALAPFDVVHLHEPLAPSPALAALRHAPGVTAATFHRAEPLVGVAFLRPLVDRALARADLRVATTEAGRTALSEILPGAYTVIRPGVDTGRFAPPARSDGPPGLVLVARGRDRVGVRFAVSVLRDLDLDAVGPVTLLGPSDAPWRTRAAVPKALRDRVSVVPDAGPEARAEAFAAARIALIATPEDVLGPPLGEAMACGCAVLVPLGAAADEAVVHGADALVLPPFTRDAWSRTIGELVADPARRAALGAAARAHASARTWDQEARELAAAYRDAIARRHDGAARVSADLHVRPGPGLSPAQIVAACAERGIAVVAVAGTGDLAAAREAAALAGEGLTVLVGQEVATTDGVLVGLLLSEPVADGMSPADAAAAIHAQGGLVLAPQTGAPSPESLRALGGAVDVHGVAGTGPEAPDEDDAALLRRRGLRVAWGSEAARPEDVGAHLTELRGFSDAAGLLEALADARPAEPGRRRAPREQGARRRGRGRRLPKS
jgi:phosphatidylinositol alpha-mannosyltransferase